MKVVRLEVGDIFKLNVEMKIEEVSKTNHNMLNIAYHVGEGQKSSVSVLLLVLVSCLLHFLNTCLLHFFLILLILVSVCLILSLSPLLGLPAYGGEGVGCACGSGAAVH